MVATSKLKRAQDRVAAARPYAERLAEVIERLLTPELAARYPLLRQPEQVRRAAVVLLTANRGLAGAFNANLIREARALLERLRGAGGGDGAARGGEEGDQLLPLPAAGDGRHAAPTSATGRRRRTRSR